MPAFTEFPASPRAWHRHVLGLALPVVLANLTQPLLAAVDTAMAGHLDDPAALGGVALGGVLFSFLLWGFGFLRMGTTGLVAQAHGAGDEVTALAHLLRGLATAVLIGLLVVALQAWLIAPGLHLLGGSEAVQQTALLYARARIWSAPFALCNYVLLGYCLGRQRPALALALQVGINAVNMLAAGGLVLLLHQGVAGIGHATALADSIGCALGLALLARRGVFARWRHVHTAALCETRALRHMFAVNRDIFMRTITLLGSFAWFAHVGARQGDTLLAANALLLNFQTFMAYALDGFAHAAEALVGAALGAARPDALRAGVRYTLRWAIAGALLFAAGYRMIGPPLIDLLTDHAEVRAAARDYLIWATLLPLASVTGFLLDGVFIGATRTRELMQAMLVCGGFFLAISFPLVASFGNHGLWLSLLLFMAARGIGLWLFLPRLLRVPGALQSPTPAPAGTL